MPIETITFNGKEYPKFQSEGNAARWIMPFAKYYCKGRGVDVGFSKVEWKLPNAIGIDECLGQPQTAMNIWESELDFLFSSHCLEHIKENWNNVLDYWLKIIRIGGIIFLYLPHKSQEYWLPENNRKHIHSFTGEEITAYFTKLGHKVFCSGVDLNNSFVVVCEKKSNEYCEKYIKRNNLKIGEILGEDILMKGCFDKSINQQPFHLKHDINDFTDNIKANRLKSEKIVEPHSIKNYELTNHIRVEFGMRALSFEEYNKLV